MLRRPFRYLCVGVHWLHVYARRRTASVFGICATAGGGVGSRRWQNRSWTMPATGWTRFPSVALAVSMYLLVFDRWHYRRQVLAPACSLRGFVDFDRLPALSLLRGRGGGRSHGSRRPFGRCLCTRALSLKKNATARPKRWTQHRLHRQDDIVSQSPSLNTTHDSLANILYRLTDGVGAGYHLFDWNNLKWTVSAGLTRSPRPTRHRIALRRVCLESNFKYDLISRFFTKIRYFIMAEREDSNPRYPFGVCTLSRRVPSTTRPSLPPGAENCGRAAPRKQSISTGAFGERGNGFKSLESRPGWRC